MSASKVRAIAFYLPQFHPIPENDEWWGKGFTEWTNVGKAKPMYRGHYQPNLPSDFGFYDLRVPEVRMAQAELARQYGIEGFCYWHYWFGNGKQLLERPFNEVLSSKEPNFPFCLSWANQTWSGIWHGTPNRILIEQTYPGMEDYRRHFETVLEAFLDPRYIHVDGKPLFLVYAPESLPDPRRFTDYWRELALKAGLKGIYFVGNEYPGWQPKERGFDAMVMNIMPHVFAKLGAMSESFFVRKVRHLTEKDLRHYYRKIFKKPRVYPYKKAIEIANVPLKDITEHPSVFPNWDNSPRSGTNAFVFHGSTPELYQEHLKKAIDQIVDRPFDHRLLFIKSWNEWAEGNHLEPCRKWGHAYLEATRNAVSGYKTRVSGANSNTYASVRLQISK